MPITTRFEVGQQVWLATCECKQETIVCPDCLGQTTWEAKLPNGETLIIGCPTCRSAFGGSTGKIQGEYRGFPAVTPCSIASVRIESSGEVTKVEYVTTSGIWADECNLFTDKAEAQVRAEQLSAETDARTAESWAVANGHRRGRAGTSEASYRRGIANAKKDIARLESYLERIREGKAKE